MQSRDENRAFHNPVRKDFLATMLANKIPQNEITQILIRAYGLLMHFADYESGCVMRRIFKVGVTQPDVLLASYDKYQDVIQYHVFNEEDATSKTILHMAIDEEILTASLAAAYSQYDAKLRYLAMLYLDSYHNYKLLSEQAQALQPVETQTYFPALPAELSQEMQTEIIKLIGFREATGNEFKDPRWEELNKQINLPSLDAPSNSDEVARKFFYNPCAFGSHLYESLTVACYIQEVVVSLAANYIAEGLLSESTLKACQERWRKYNSIPCKIRQNENADTRSTNILDDLDVNNPRHIRDFATLSKIVNFENLKYYFSPVVLNKVTIKKVYFKLLFDEIETFFLNQEKRYNSFPKPASAQSDFIYSNDFSIEFMRHAVVVEAANAWVNDADKINVFKKELQLEAEALMVYARIKSNGTLCSLVPAGYETLLRDTKFKTLADVKNCLSKGYFDYEQIETRYESQSNKSAYLNFLLSIYTGAGMIILKLIAPPEQAKNLYDETNYYNARMSIAKIQNDFSLEEKKSEHKHLSTGVSQYDQADASAQRLPFQGLYYEHRDFLKSETAFILKTRFYSPTGSYKIVHKLYNFVLHFCDYESQGLMAEIFNIKLPKQDVVLATFDRQTAKLKWHPETLKNYEDKIIIQMILDENALTEPLSKVYDSYDTKMYFLSRLFLRTHAQYCGAQVKLQHIEPELNHPNMPMLDTGIRFIDQLAGYMAKFSNNKYPSSKQWDETHAKISDPICRLTISPRRTIVGVPADNQAAQRKVYHRFIHQPYHAGSELDEIQIAMCFIEETIYTAGSKAVPAMAIFQEATVALHERGWRHFNSVKCAIDSAGRLTINVAKDNFKEMRALAIIKKLVDLNNLAYVLSPAELKNQPNKFDYFTALLDECSKFMELRNDLFSGKFHDHYILSVFLAVYLNEKSLENLHTPAATGPGMTDYSAPAQPRSANKDLAVLARDATALLIYIDIISANSMSELTGFELNFIPEMLPAVKLEALKQQANNSFDIEKFSAMLISQVTSVEKLTFLTNAYISTGLLLLRLNSPSRDLYDLTDYNAVRSAIHKKATKAADLTNSTTLLASTSTLITAQIQRLLDAKKIAQASAQSRRAKPPTAKAKVKSKVEAQPSEVKKDPPKKQREHKPDSSDPVTTPTFLLPRPEQPVNLPWVSGENNMQSANETVINDAKEEFGNEVFDLQNIVKKNAMAIYITAGATRSEAALAHVKVFQFIMKFCDYESRGMLPELLGFRFSDDTSLLGSFDIEARKIKWYPQNDEHLKVKNLISSLIDEDKILIPLTKVYSNYRYKITTLANLYLYAYNLFTHFREQLASFENQVVEVLPTFDPKAKLEFDSKLAELTRLKDQAGNEPFTPEWKEKYRFVDQAIYLSENATIQGSGKLLDIHQYSETVLMKKYFFLPYYPGSNLNEFATAVCFIQETIYYVSKKYLTDDLLRKSPQHLLIWKNYIAIKVHESHDGRLIIAADTKDLRQMRDVCIVNKLVNLDKLNTFLTADVIHAQPYKEIYFKMLLDEVTACLLANKISLSENPAPEIDPDLACILSSDFVHAYARHDNITLAAKELANDASAKQRFYKSFHIEACVLMTYADKNGGKRMAELTGFKLDESLVITDPQLLTKFSTSFFNGTGYFDYDKIDSQLRSLKTMQEQLHFLTNIYISAGVLILRLNTPQELVIDKTQYEKLRNKIMLTDNVARLVTPAPQTPANNSAQAMANMTAAMQSARANVWPSTISDERIKQVICERYLNVAVKLDDSDLMKALCFIQAAFNIATHDFFLQMEYAQRRQIIQRRWDKHLTVLPKFSESNGIEFDVAAKPQASELTKFKALINLERLNKLLVTHTESLALTPSTKPSLLRKLFEEIEDYIIGEMQKTAYKHISPHLNAIYKTEFAKTHLRHMAVEELAAKYDRNEDITDLYNDLSIGVSKFMEYCDRISDGLLVTITGHDYKISPMLFSRHETEGPLAKLRTDANVYFNLDKFENALDALTTYRAKLEFLTAQFTEAYSIEKNMLKAQPNRMTTSSVMRPNGRALQTISSLPISHIDANKIRVEINNIVKAYESSEVKPQARKQKSKKARNVNASDESKSEQPILPNNSTLSLSPIEQQLIQFQSDFNTARGKFNNMVSSKIASIQEELQSLTIQLRQTLALDNEERQYNLRPHIQLVNNLKREVYLDISYVATQIQRAFAAMKPAEEEKLEENIIRLKNINAEVTTLDANREKLLTEIQQEANVLDHIIPKKTLKKAEEAYQEAQRKKERLAREVEEEKKIRSKKEKVDRPRTKPAGIPAPLNLAPKKLATPLKKSENKSSRPDPRAGMRLLHLNEACKNLVFIQKILTVYKVANPNKPEIVHFALLYNIFRCFQSLKMYQQKGGSTRSINPDEIINLRNMIIHHGATTAHPEIVAEFAAEINAKLPKDILKLTNRSLSGFELPDNRRQELMAEFNLLEPSVKYSPFLDHSMLVLDDTPLYIKLVAFHEEKVDNNNVAETCDSILETFIPKMKDILSKLVKGISMDSGITVEHFFDTLYFELQALRMLGSICGEFEAYFKKTHKDKNLLEFLAICRTDVRNHVAHDDVDLIESLNWFRQLNAALEKVDVKHFLAKPKRSNPTAFFPTRSAPSSSSAGSAMDAKYDNKPPTAGKGLR